LQEQSMTRVQGFVLGLTLLLLVNVCVGQTPRQKAQALTAKLNQDQKIDMVHGWGGGYVGNINAIGAFNIPAVHMQDGPQGVADGVTQVTCWPSSSAVGMTWDLELMLQWGTALGVEQRIKGTNVHLGPDVNIARVPTGGRIFEMLGGEDPYLAARMVVPYVKGVQSAGVLANAKHYINNDQEADRDRVSVSVDERTNWELYYQPFIAAVQEGGVNSIMCSYNKINNTYACENKQTLHDLKERMGFQGFVVSDWGATHSTANSANTGLDIQMPDDGFFGNNLKNAVASGQVTQATLDEMVTRVLTGLYANGIMDNPQTGNLNANAQSDAHTSLARKLAVSSTVLLKNKNGILPIKNVKSIALIGDQVVGPMAAGGGSGHVNPPYVIPPLQGIKERVGSGIAVDNIGSGNPSAAAALAKSHDIAVVFVATGSSEGGDRGNLMLNPASQNDLISTVAAAQPNTVVVLYTAGAVLMPWANSVAGIIFGGFSGQECGHAIADILFGDYNPSGKLSLTFPVNQNDWFSGMATQYPGVNLQEQYSEKLLVGYRWYESRNITPLFPFGHGLSYTTFEFSNIKFTGSISSGLMVSVEVKNSGAVAGAEVVQLYLSFPESAGEPPKQLRGFKKVSFNAGQTQTVTFNLGTRDVSIWDITLANWRAVAGTFTVSIGSSSADIKIKGTFNN
jgi:beta-glucosidase